MPHSAARKTRPYIHYSFPSTLGAIQTNMQGFETNWLTSSHHSSFIAKDGIGFSLSNINILIQEVHRNNALLLGFDIFREQLTIVKLAFQLLNIQNESQACGKGKRMRGQVFKAKETQNKQTSKLNPFQCRVVRTLLVQDPVGNLVETDMARPARSLMGMI